jgi:hypothetical protein
MGWRGNKVQERTSLQNGVLEVRKEKTKEGLKNGLKGHE